MHPFVVNRICCLMKKRILLVLFTFCCYIGISAQNENYLYLKDTTIEKDFVLLEEYPNMSSENDSIDESDLVMYNLENFDVDSLVTVIERKAINILKHSDIQEVDWNSIPYVDSINNDSSLHILHIDYYSGGTMGMIPNTTWIKEKNNQLLFYPFQENCYLNNITLIQEDTYLCIGYEKLDGASWILKVYVVDIANGQLKFLPAFGKAFPKNYEVQNAEASYEIQTNILEITVNEPIATMSHDELKKFFEKETNSCFSITYPDTTEGAPVLLTTHYDKGIFTKP